MPILQKTWQVFSKQFVVANGGIVIVVFAHFIFVFWWKFESQRIFFNKRNFGRITMVVFRFCAVTHQPRLVTMGRMIN